MAGILNLIVVILELIAFSNERISTFEDVCYFAYPCSSTIENADGTVSPDPSITEDIFMKSAIYMSLYEGSTKGGFVIDKTWQFRPKTVLS